MSTPIVVPRLNENDDEVLVVELTAEHGARVRAGDPLLAVETSKALVEIAAETEGFVAWTVAVGETVSVPAQVGVLVADAADVAAAPVTPTAPAAGATVATAPARRAAEELGIELDDVVASGPIVTERDVRAHAQEAKREEPVAEVEPPGRISDKLRAWLREAPEDIASLSSAEKVALYRTNGAAIGAHVTIGAGSIVDAEFVALGDDTSIGDDVRVRARRFELGQLCQVGANCRFFCRDFVAGDVVTLRWDVAVVDGQGGIHDCHIGDLSFVAYDTYLNTDRDVRIGERVCLSPGVRIYTHRKWLEAYDGYPFAYAPVSIGDRSWLGPGALVLPGVVLGTEVTVMASSVVASNAPAGALVGGIPASVVKKDQRRQLDGAARDALLVEILAGNDRALAALGWTLRADAPPEGVWSGVIEGEQGRSRIVADGDRVVVTALDGECGVTEFDLAGHRVTGARDAASDAVRHLLYKYGTLFEPRLWRFGSRLDETAY